MQRSCCFFALLAGLLPSCSIGHEGAALVRWRLVDAVTGARASGCSVGSGPSLVVVDQVQLLVEDLAGNHVSCPSCVFSCGPLEGTTAFALAPATYRFTLRALRCGATIGFTPPVVTRDVKPGEITNLGAIEILIPAGTSESCDAGAARDAGA